MFNVDELGREAKGNTVRFCIYLPNIEKSKGFAVKVYAIKKQGRFDVNVLASVHELALFPIHAGGGKKKHD
jgi:hypothetical protein